MANTVLLRVAIKKKWDSKHLISRGPSYGPNQISISRPVLSCKTLKSQNLAWSWERRSYFRNSFSTTQNVTLTLKPILLSFPYPAGIRYEETQSKSMGEHSNMTQPPQPPQPRFQNRCNSGYAQDRSNSPHWRGTTADGRNDRRRKRRALISAPVRIRSLNTTAAEPDEICTTLDVSRNGILFVTCNQTFHRGMEVAVTFPYTKCPGIPTLEQPGSIVRVSALSEGKIAVAIGFALGMNESAAAATALNSDQVSESLGACESRKRPLILVVEADATLRDSLKGYLTAEGYKVIAVDNASDAREVLNMLTPSLLIAEIEGEGLPGFDLCVHVKMTPRLKHIPVMLTTESAYPSDYSSAHSLGAVVCLAKPFRQERLGHVVRLLAPPNQVSPQVPSPRTPDHTRGPRRRRGSNRR